MTMDSRQQILYALRDAKLTRILKIWTVKTMDYEGISVISGETLMLTRKEGRVF